MQAHSLRFADALEEATGGWLQRGDAFPADSGSPSPCLAAMPYWREGRRMIGRQTVIEQDLLPVSDGISAAALPINDAGELQSIAIGNYANDHHYPGPDWPLAPKSCRWGGRWTGTPFCIPYGALLSESINNLLAADKAFSTSHMANGATRLQPLILNIGQAAGAAAALSVYHEQLPSDLLPRELQNALTSDHQAPAKVLPDWDQNGRLSLAQGADEFEGVVVPDEAGSYALLCEQEKSWPLITLEPSVHNWFTSLKEPTPARLMAIKNSWGPWLRVVRVG